MFPLAGKTFPSSTDELADAITTALADVFTLRNGNAIELNGGKFPTIKTVNIDLDGSIISANKPPPKPIGTGKRTPGPRVDKLNLSAQPIRYERAKLNLKLSATGLKFDFDRDKRGNPVLVLTDAKNGKVDARISKDDIEALLTEAASLAAKQGITIEDFDLDLQKAGPRAIAADVRVTAKKMGITGVIRITGQLDFDDQLNATISNLDCHGEGIVGSVAAGVVKRKIAPYDGTTIPLMASFSLDDVTLRELKIDLTEDLHVSAEFGSA